MGLLRHERRLVEARQDELELAWIGVDIADGEDALLVRLEFLGVDRDEVLVQLEAPIGYRAELHGEPEERHHDLGRLLEGGAVGTLYRDRTELAVLAVQFRHLTELETNVAAVDERQHLLHRGRRRPKLCAAMQQRDRICHRLQVQGPIERRIADANVEYDQSAQALHLANRVEYRLTFVFLDPWKRRTLRREGAAAGRDHHH